MGPGPLRLYAPTKTHNRQNRRKEFIKRNDDHKIHPQSLFIRWVLFYISLLAFQNNGSAFSSGANGFSPSQECAGHPNDAAPNASFDAPALEKPDARIHKTGFKRIFLALTAGLYRGYLT